MSVEEVDGVLPENKDARTAFFEKSGKRNYPQVFIREPGAQGGCGRGGGGVAR